MSSTRNVAGRSGHVDERTAVERDGGVHMKVTRKDRDWMKNNGIADIAIYISYPSLTIEGNLEYDVLLEHDAAIYIYSHEDLLGEGYKFTLAKLIMSTKNPNHSKLKPWIQQHTVPITYDLGLRSAVWIIYPSADTMNDRICVVVRYYNKLAFTLDFLQKFIPKYYIQHIDHIEKELIGNNFVISNKLRNGILLTNGGEGLASDNDVICISNSYQGDSPKYAYMKIQLHCMHHLVQLYKAHIKQIGQEVMDKVGRVLQGFLSTRYQESPKWAFVDVGKEMRAKEFDSQIKLKAGESPEWEGTKNKKITSIEYEDSIKIWGSKAIVRNFIAKRASNFILSNTDLTLTHYPNSGRMKIEVFVSHVWM